MSGVFPTLFTVFLCLLPSSGNRPVFDVDVWIQILFLPHDTPVGSVIYRIRASDNQPEPDYPLTFTAASTANPIVQIVPVSDTEADMVLRRPMQKGEIYPLILQVVDTRNQKNTVEMKLNATDVSATPSLVFTSYPRQTLKVREDSRIGRTIGSVTARKNPDSLRYPELRLSGSEKFGLETSFQNANEIIGNIVLKEELDYEDRYFYLLNITSLGGYMEKQLDNRNIIILNIPVIVEDVPDENPVFEEIPLVTQVKANADEGSSVMKISTKGENDNIIYRIQGDNSEYFKIDPRNGDITVARPLHQIIKGCQSTPVILRVSAEVQSTTRAMVSSKEVLVMVEQPAVASVPEFPAPVYTTSIDEQSPIFTLLPFPEHLSVKDKAKCAILELMLQNSQASLVSALDIFDIKPNLIVHEGTFDIFVKNSTLLDFEIFKEIQFQVVAYDRQAPSSSRGTATVTVTLNDLNDNAPQFTKAEYVVTISENVVEGTVLAQVTATDVDGGNFGKIRYTGLAGDQDLIRHLRLDEETGAIYLTGDYVFDRETKTEHEISVEARDNEGRGIANRTKVTIKVKDVNDNRPMFPRSYYPVCLPSNQRRGDAFFTVWAMDLDEPDTPNSQISYSIIRGNENNLFYISSNGVLSLSGDASRVSNGTVLIVRATDGGSPPQSSDATVQITTEATGCKQRMVDFLIDNSKEDVERNKDIMESFLMNLNGGSFTKIDSVQTVNADPRNERLTTGNATYPRAKITARVTEHENNSIIDLTVLKRRNSGSVPILPVEGSNGEIEIPPEPNSAWKWVLIALLILLALALLILLCCCLCRPTSKKKTSSQVNSHSNQRLISQSSSPGSHSKHHTHHQHRHRGKRISSAPANGRAVANGRVPTNIQYSRHMQDDWGRNKDEDVLVDPTTGKRYLVRNENGNKILVRQDDEKQNRKVTRGTNVNESSLQTESLITDVNGTVVSLEDDAKKSRLKNQFLEKKSLFTIAYDGMHSKHDLLKDTDDTSPPTVS